MRMDLVKPRYETFDELYEYCYKVAGTVGLMTTPVMGIDPTYKASPEQACGAGIQQHSLAAFWALRRFRVLPCLKTSPEQGNNLGT